MYEFCFIKISLKFVAKVRINNIPTLVQIIAWRWPGIIWTNDGSFYWCIYASLGLNVLTSHFQPFPRDNAAFAINHVNIVPADVLAALSGHLQPLHADVDHPMDNGLLLRKFQAIYRKTFNIRRTLVGNKIVDHSDVVGASPVGAAPTTSSFST